MTSQEIPAQARYMPLILEALRDIGGSAKASSVKDWVAAKLAEDGVEIPSETLASGAPKFPNDLQFSRLFLVNAKLLEEKSVSGYGKWKLTGLGWSTVLTPEDAMALMTSSAKQSGGKTEPIPAPQMTIPETEDEKSQLYGILKGMDPGGFERLCSRIMEVTGVSVDVANGKSGDGGVDGFGRMPFGPASLVKVTVAWQCKRFVDGNVTSSAVRDFRGAIEGKAIFGMIFSTSGFTADAKKEAQRPGSTRIELLDVERLVAVICENEMGVAKVMQPVYTVDPKYFEEFKNQKSANQAQMELKP